MLQLTESVNPRTRNIDQVSTLDMVRLIAEEDARVAPAVAIEQTKIARAIEVVAERFLRGGRLIYIGAGTSGRMGVLDASEIPPTFGVPRERVIGLIAGGITAVTESIEGAEDDVAAGARDITSLTVSQVDVVIGIAASGGTPYVLGGMQEAKKRGAFVGALVCNQPSPMEQIADLTIAPLVGPEVITGSTRLKAGTAQKLVLNMISTGVMVRVGKTYGNLMVDVQTTNSKLRDRARRIVEMACELSSAEADALLARCNGEVKTALVVELTGVDPVDARRRLGQTRGMVRKAIESNGP